MKKISAVSVDSVDHLSFLSDLTGNCVPAIEQTNMKRRTVMRFPFRVIAIFYFCLANSSFAQLQLAPNPGCANSAPFCRTSLQFQPGIFSPVAVMGFHDSVLYGWTVISSGACPKSKPGAPVASGPTLCFYTSTSLAPENWVLRGQYPTDQSAIEIVFAPGVCSAYKYIYTTGHHILRATSSPADWNFQDIINNINFPGQGIPPNIPPDTAARRASFAIADLGWTTRLFYGNYNDHTYNPPTGPPGGLVWHSDDCGDSWSPPFMFGGREVHSINADPANNWYVYAVIDSECAPDGTSCPSFAPTLWRSTDGGISFNPVAENRLPIDVVLPSASNSAFMEADGDPLGPLQSWDKVNGGDIQVGAFYPFLNLEPTWSGGAAGGIGLTSEQNIFLETTPGNFSLREGLWYFAPPFYDTATLLEDLAPPIAYITASNGTATAYTFGVHSIQPGDLINIQGVNPPAFNTVDANGGPTSVPVTVTGLNSFIYACDSCPEDEIGGNGLATKLGIILWPNRTVEATDYSTGISYLYSSNFRFIKPEFTGAHQVMSSLDMGGGFYEVFFIGTDQHVHALFNNANVGAWGNHDVNSYAGAPTNTIPEAGSSLASLNLGNGFYEVFFIGTDQHVHVLFDNANVGAWGNHDVNSYASWPTDITPVTGSALSALLQTNGNSAVFCIGKDQHVHMLLNSSGSWANYDLNASVGAANIVPVAGSALSSLDLGNGNLAVFFIGADQHVHMLSNSNGSWVNQDINSISGIPTNTSPAIWTQLSTVDLGNGNSETFFIGVDLHVHMLKNWNGLWGNHDVNSYAGAPTNITPMLASPVEAFNLANGNSETFFIGTDQHAHMLVNWNGAWGNHDVTSYAGAPTDVIPTIRSPYTTINLGNGNAETFFIGTDQHVHMLLNWNGAWGNHNINSYGGAPTNVDPALP